MSYADLHLSRHEQTYGFNSIWECPDVLWHQCCAKINAYSKNKTWFPCVIRVWWNTSNDIFWASKSALKQRREQRHFPDMFRQHLSYIPAKQAETRILLSGLANNFTALKHIFLFHCESAKSQLSLYSIGSVISYVTVNIWVVLLHWGCEAMLQVVLQTSSDCMTDTWKSCLLYGI